VNALGYGKVAANCVWLAVLALAITSGYHLLDGRPRRPQAA
jgi:hypothetical protein